MAQVLNAVINAMAISALYALVAIGFTLIFGIGGVLNLAHGASITIGAFTAFYVTTIFGAGVWVGLLVATLVAGIFSTVAYFGLVRWTKDDPITVMIITLILALLIERIFLLVEGNRTKFLPSLLDDVISVQGARFEANWIVIFVVSWAIIIGLIIFIDRTKYGKAIVAMSMNKRGASLMGISETQIELIIWGVAGAFAGIAGVFLGTFQGIAFNTGFQPLILSFAIVVLGGIGSVRGSLVGAYLVGFLQVFTASYVTPRLTGLIPLLVLAVVLLYKPEGLFGREIAG